MRRINGKLTVADRSGALFLLAHNPKVAGSNPAPATKFQRLTAWHLATPVSFVSDLCLSRLERPLSRGLIHLFGAAPSAARLCEHSSGATVAGAYHARDRRQICVDRMQIMIGQLLKVRPDHHLKQIAVERRVEAVRGDGRPVAIWMKSIVVNTVSQGVEELGESSRRDSGLIRRQVAGHDVGGNGAGGNRADLTEIPTAAQIRDGIHDLRRSKRTQALVRVVAGCVLGGGAGAVTTVASDHRIDNVAAESD